MTARPPKVPVLFTHFGDPWIRGSEQVLLDLLAKLDRTRIEPVAWCNGAEMAARCQALEVPTYRDDFNLPWLDYNNRDFSPRRYLALFRRGRSLLRKHGIRVIHVNSAAPMQWMVPVAWSAGVPLLCHLHIGYLRRSRYVALLHQADLLVGVSRHVVSDLAADGVPAERLRVIYNGIDFERIPPAATDVRAAFGIPADAPVIASIGSLIVRKGHDLLLRALAILPKSGPAPHLIIGGDGEEQGALEALSQSLGLSQQVHFLGYTRDIAAICAAADVFALVSRDEAFPLTLLEAGHFGLPVVATRVGGVGELVVDGETGLLVERGDVAGIAAALTRLLADPGLREGFGAAGRSRVHRLFSATAMAESFMECYASLAEHRPGRIRLSRLTPYARMFRRGPVREGHAR